MLLRKLCFVAAVHEPSGFAVMTRHSPEGLRPAATKNMNHIKKE